jgi:C4-dicarboxylate-specific signal transduction histidine kinase
MMELAMAHIHCTASVEDLRGISLREVPPSPFAHTRETERQESESLAERIHADRIAIIGRLAASIPHEVNQPIAAMVTNRLLKKSLRATRGV